MLKLSAEDTLLLLTCRIYLRDADDDSIRHLVNKQLDWPYVLWRAENYRTLPILYEHLQRLNLLGQIPEEVGTYLNGWSTLSAARSVEQFRELGIILDTFQSANIDCFILKGAALSALYFQNPLARPMQDLDLMIYPTDAARAQKVMFKLGYRHGVWDPGTARFTPMYRRITPDLVRHHYEIPSFTKVVTADSPLPASSIPWTWRKQHIKCHVDDDRILTLPIFVDLHFNLSAGIDIQDVWRGANREIVLGKPVRVQSATGMLWFLAARLYNEAFQYSTLKLIMLGDIHAVLHERGDDVDWAELLVIAHKYGMHPALFYVLAQLKNLTGIDVPENVLDNLKPDPKKIPIRHDWGDVMPKLLSLPAIHEIKLA